MTANVSKRVLAIDDDHLDCVLLSEAAREAQVDWELVEAQDGDKAISYLENTSESLPSLILLDLNLPGEGGLQVLERLRKLPLTQNIPIILYTASNELSQKNKALELGAMDVIRKPEQFEALISKISEIDRLLE